MCLSDVMRGTYDGFVKQIEDMNHTNPTKAEAYLNRLINKTGMLNKDKWAKPANTNKTRATNRTKPKKRKR